MREEGDLEDLNEDKKSDELLKNMEVPKIARIVLNMWKSRKELLKVDKWLLNNLKFHLVLFWTTVLQCTLIIIIIIIM